MPHPPAPDSAVTSDLDLAYPALTLATQQWCLAGRALKQGGPVSGPCCTWQDLDLDLPALFCTMGNRSQGTGLGVHRRTCERAGTEVSFTENSRSIVYPEPTDRAGAVLPCLRAPSTRVRLEQTTVSSCELAERNHHCGLLQAHPWQSDSNLQALLSSPCVPSTVLDTKEDPREGLLSALGRF